MPRSVPRDNARSSMSTWMRFSPRSSSATIRSCAASLLSYEARTFGVRSAMPSVTAKRRCPELIFVMPRFDIYKAVSLQIREIFAEYTPIIEPLSRERPILTSPRT
jgi:DNA polymerase IV